MLHTETLFRQFHGRVVREDGSRPPPAPLHTFPPLRIQAPSEGMPEDLVSYQAPWDPVLCRVSLATSKIYQAGANIVWVKALATDSPIPVTASASWCQICEFADMFFRRDGNRAKVQGDGRIIFPTILEAFTDRPLWTGAGPALAAAPALEAALAASEAAPAPTLQDGELLLLGGHALVQAWWVSTARALVAGDLLDVAALWQCGLSVTVLLRDEPSRPLSCCRTPSSSPRRSVCRRRR